MCSLTTMSYITPGIFKVYKCLFEYMEGLLYGSWSKQLKPMVVLNFIVVHDSISFSIHTVYNIVWFSKFLYVLAKLEIIIILQALFTLITSLKSPTCKTALTKTYYCIFYLCRNCSLTSNVLLSVIIIF